MRLPRGTISQLIDRTGLSGPYICDLIAGRKRPGRERALVMQEASGVDAATWLYGSAQEIKQALLSSQVTASQASLDHNLPQAVAAGQR